MPFVVVVLFLLCLGSPVVSIRFSGSRSFKSDTTSDFDTNMVQLYPEGFGLDIGGNVTIELTASANSNASNMMFVLYRQTAWRLFEAAQFQFDYGDTFMCTFPAYYRQILHAGHNLIHVTINEFEQYAFLVVKCEPGSLSGTVEISYSIHAVNPGGDELHVKDQPYVYLYPILVGVYGFLLLLWIFVNVIHYSYIRLPQVFLTGAYLLYALQFVFKFLFYRELSRLGEFTRNIFEIAAEIYLHVILLIIALGWQSIVRAIAIDLKAILFVAFALFVLFALAKSVWVVPPEVMPLFEAGYWAVKIVLEMGVLVALLRSQRVLQKYRFSKRLTHMEVYLHYRSFRCLFWCYACHAAIPVLLAIAHFAFLYWYEYYMYVAMLEMNVIGVFVFLIVFFRAIPYHQYTSVLDHKKTI